MADGIPNIDFDIEPAEVVTVPIDDTLSIEGEAADAKAVGDALANKADKSELSAAVKVDGQAADAFGDIVLLAEHIPMDGSANPKSVGEEIATLKGRTGADIPLSGADGAPSVAQAIDAIDSGATVEGGALKLSGAVADGTAEVRALELDGQTLPLRDGGAVRSVNGEKADGVGNVAVTRVEFANNLVADDAQSNLGAYVIRTSGGTTPIASGSAWLARLRGNLAHAGQVQEVLTCVVQAAAREEGETPITASLDAAAFKAAVSDSAVFTLTYTTEWSANPELIGVTVTGDPVSGDAIVVTYVKADRGEITPATPASFRATGWNLYSHANGYARVLKYSDTYGFRVAGAYTGLAFSETLNGARETISPVNGHFNVPSDGYVWVTGGNASSTCVYMTWSDWLDGHAGAFAPYAEAVIDLSTLMAEHFPDGLLAVGAVADEIDFSLQRAVSAVEKLAWSEETAAALDAAGRAYVADREWIYAVRETPLTYEISLGNAYAVSDHGMEFFTGTDVAVDVAALYGQNLRDKLRADVLTISQQTLTAAQKAQVQANIGVYSKSETDAAIQQSTADVAHTVFKEIPSGATWYLNHTSTVLFWCDRGGMWTEGTAQRTLDTVKENSQINVTRVNASKIAIKNNYNFGASIIAISAAAPTFTDS